MARIFSKTGDIEIIPHKKKTYQGDGPRTKSCKRGSRPRRKLSRGQGRGSITKTASIMAKEYPYPEFLEETMFAEQGTKVLITDPAADVLLEKARQRKLKEKYPQWVQDEE